MKKLLVVLILYFFFNTLFSQKRVIDSLNTYLQTNSSQLHDTTRAETLNTLARQFQCINPGTALLSRENKWVKVRTNLTHNWSALLITKLI